ncbi:hypothetical protein [Glutamicibacter sp. TV12E]|uniref:hypothetical protein n=1 Tax=Glutamicibacter sp. TV12E TaxID=3446362 RepID=UPI00403370DA
MSTRQTKDWWLELCGQFLDKYPEVNTEDAKSVIEALTQINPSDAVTNHYSDVWEASESWEKYDLHFEWCLAAIVTGIRTYKANKDQEPTA